MHNNALCFFLFYEFHIVITLSFNVTVALLFYFHLGAPDIGP